MPYTKRQSRQVSTSCAATKRLITAHRLASFAEALQKTQAAAKMRIIANTRSVILSSISYETFIIYQPCLLILPMIGTHVILVADACMGDRTSGRI